MTADAPAPRGLIGVGVGGLALEALVLLLATPAVASAERGHVTFWHLAYLLGLAVLIIFSAAWLRRPHGLVPGTVVQPLVIAAGVVTWPMYVVGLIFAGIWGYWLHLRRAAA